MAYSSPCDLKGRARLRFQSINVQPATSPKGEVRIKLLIDDVELYSSPYVKWGKSLQWEEPIPCDVFPNTKIRVLLMDKRTLRDDQILETLDGFASDMIKADVAKFAKISDNQRSTVTFTFATEDKISETFRIARRWVEQLQTLNQTPVTHSTTCQSFERILFVVSSLFESHPCARSAYNQTVMAWKVLHKQGTRQRILDFIVLFVNLLPRYETIKIASEQPELNSTVTSVLHMIEDMSGLLIRTIRENTSMFRTDSTASLNFPDKSNSFLEEMSLVMAQLVTKMESCSLNHYSKAEALLLRSLQAEYCAQYDPGKICMPGTRNKAVGDIKSWCLTRGEIPEILWLCGQFGVGKTAIAASVCQQLVQKAENVLAASFFCRRGDPRLSDPECVLKAVIFGLSARFPALGSLVIDFLRQRGEESGSSDNALATELMDRINSSLKALDRPGVLVVIVDAVDECGTDDTRGKLIAHLWSMCQHARWLRVFLTSRNNSDVARNLDPTTSKGFIFYELAPDDTSRDISIYCRTMLNNIAATEDWVQRELEQLCKHADGLFLWASAACNYILAIRRSIYLLDGEPLGLWWSRGCSRSHGRYLDQLILYWAFLI